MGSGHRTSLKTISTLSEFHLVDSMVNCFAEGKEGPPQIYLAQIFQRNFGMRTTTFLCITLKTRPIQLER